LAKKRFHCLNEALCFVSSSVLAESLLLRNPLLRQALSVGSHFKKRKNNKTMISKFKALPKGVQRAIIVASLILPYIAGYIMDDTHKQEWFLIGLIICTPVYWVLTFAGIWIYEGFKTDK
jgi:hypothetical protein